MRSSLATMLLMMSGAAVAAAQTAGMPASGEAAGNIRLDARIVVVENSAVSRAGVSYVVLASDRVSVSTRAGTTRRGSGVAVESRPLGVAAFLEFVRQRRAVSSEATQQIVVLSGGTGRIASLDLSVDRFAARSRGPSLVVTPTLLDDGRIHVRVIAQNEDVVADSWTGQVVDGSPVRVATELVLQPGEPAIIGSGSASQSASTSGILHIGRDDYHRDILVVLSAEPMSLPR
jgi:hypothetical protein